MNSSLTTHYEGLVRQALAGTGLATREADLASALAKLADSKVDWSKWVSLILLGLILATQFYFAHNINARLDRLEADLSALIVRMDRLIARMDGLEEEVHQRSVWQREHNDLYRRTER